MMLLAVAGLCLGPLSSVLAASNWGFRAPRWALFVWTTLGGIGFTAGVGWGLTFLPNPESDGLARQLGAFVRAFPHQLLRGVSPWGVVGLSLSCDAVVVVGSACAVAMWRLGRERGALRAAIDLLGRPWRGGALVIGFHRPTAYFLPGGGGRIVLSTALTETADDQSLLAILAHERAHQTYHHSALALVPTALDSLFAFVPWVRHGARLIPLLCECAADDAARTVTSDATLRRALEYFDFPEAATPACALTMNGADLPTRVTRLELQDRQWLPLAWAWSLFVILNFSVLMYCFFR